MKTVGLVGRWLRALQWGAIGAGIGFAIAATGMATYEGFFLRGAVRTDGVVSQFDESTQSDQDGSQTVNYAPVFSYVVGGRTYTIHSKSGSNPPEFSVGQKVPVVYHVDDPREAQIDTFGQKWELAVIFAIAGPFVALMGFAIRYFRRRSESS